MTIQKLNPAPTGHYSVNNRAIVLQDSLEFYQKFCEDNFSTIYQQIDFNFNNCRQVFNFSAIIFHVTKAIVLGRLSDFLKTALSRF